jgi:RNAse (barnase) inhibitor barstar
MKFLTAHLPTKALVGQVIEMHKREERRPIETLWDAVTGVTAVAREIEWQDERVKLETVGGDLLKLAA